VSPDDTSILVTGGGGMVGRALRARLSGATYLTRHDCDLEQPAEVRAVFDRIRPKVVVHLAALVGGIRDNVSRPYDFVFRNVMINSSTVQAAIECGAEYFIGVSSTCAYPDRVTEYPMREDQIHAGPPAPENLPYAYSKRLLGVTLDAAMRQFSLRSATLYPCNLYGPHDSFHPQKSHLVAALIRKVREAELSGAASLPLLGTGRPLRQFMFVDDLARVIADFSGRRIAGNYNVATPENLSVDAIAAIVQAAMGSTLPREYSGDLDGQFRKDASSDALLGVIPGFRFTPLAEGVRTTCEWYLGQQGERV
jgi:GDP-L-fucose synthase